MITVHLFAALEDGVTVAHCGRRGRGLTTTKVLAAVTCADCKRRDGRPRIIRQPNGPRIVAGKALEEERK